MDSLELLAKQIQQYTEQNQKDHQLINEKMDKILEETRILHSDQKINENRFDTLENGQIALKKDLEKVQKDLKNLQDQHIKRQHGWVLLGKILAGVATLTVILGFIAKIVGWI